jgi:hypothetical protein
VKGEPGDVICHPDAGKLPVIIGTVANDFPLFLPPKDDPFKYFDTKANDAHAYYDHYFPFIRKEIGMDITMNEPARFVAKAMRGSFKKCGFIGLLTSHRGIGSANY